MGCCCCKLIPGRTELFSNRFIFIKRGHHLSIRRNTFFSMVSIALKAKLFFLACLHSCLSDPGELQRAESTFSIQLLLTNLPLSLVSLWLSPSVGCFSCLGIFFPCFCLRKPRDIRGAEANNVELKTKFFRPYPSNRAITICSEEREAII